MGNSDMNRHMNNLGRLVGHKVGSGLSTYQYILNSDDLTNAYLQMRNDLGKVIKETSPSTPVEIIGLAEVPGAGNALQLQHPHGYCYNHKKIP